MCAIDLPGTPRSIKEASAFTLVEVVMCVGVVVLVLGGMLGAYVQGASRAEWSGYSLAAQALAIQQLEQAKAAVWDTSAASGKNEITNLLTTSAATLDLPISGTNAIWATNYATVSSIPISNAPAGVSVYLVKVHTVWPFMRNGRKLYFTNTVANYYAPD